MSELTRWEWYQCGCGADEFYRAIRIKRHAQFGTSEAPSPTLRCVRCHRDCTTAELQMELRRQQLRKEIAAKEAELMTEEAQRADPRATPEGAGTNSG